MDFKKKFQRIKMKKRIRRYKNQIILVIVMVVFFIILCIKSFSFNQLQGEELYGEREIVEFPFDMLDDLPEEPDWKNENVFDELLDIKYKQKDIQAWFDNIYGTNIGVVNKSGDPIPLKDCRVSSMYGLIFFKNDGNLVVVYHSISGSLIRMEVMPESIRKFNGERYCCIKEEIVDNAYYIDYENNNTLYYYINDGTPQMLKVDEGVEQVSGACVYNAFTEFPIVQKNQEIYTYILEDVEDYSQGYFMYEVPEVKFKKIVLSDITRECDDMWKGLHNRIPQIRLVYYLDECTRAYIDFAEDKIKDCESNEISVFNLAPKGATLEKEDDKYYYRILLDKSKGYDNDRLY